MKGEGSRGGGEVKGGGSRGGGDVKGEGSRLGGEVLVMVDLSVRDQAFLTPFAD